MPIRRQGPPRAEEGRRGSVLVIALIAVSTVTVLAAGFLQIAASHSRSQAAAVDRKRAFYLAEAGLAEAYLGLRVGKTGVVGSAAAPAAYGDGLLWVEVEDLGGDRLALRSVGMAGRARVSLDLFIERGVTSPHVHGVYAPGPVSLGPNTRIDSYDSAEGSWEEQFGDDIELEGVSSVGTGGELTIGGNEYNKVFIRGDVSWGQGTVPEIGDHAYIGGEQAVGGIPQTLPPVELPELVKQPGVVHASPYPIVVSPGEYALEHLVIGADAEAVLEGPATLFVSDLAMAQGARLVADTSGGPVEIFVDRSLTLDGGSMLENSTEDPRRLTLQYAGSASAGLSMSTPFHGVLYAPSAEVVITAGVELFGSLVASQVTAVRGVTVHFDRALLASAEDALWPRFLTWRIVELGENDGGAVDPFVALGVDRNALSRPALAHADQVLEIDYLDGAGDPASYSGMESGFDWTDVDEVESVARDGTEVSPNPDSVRQEPVAEHEQPLAEYLATEPPSADARARLLTESPLSETIMSRVLHGEILVSGDAKDVLIANSPLPNSIIGFLLEGIGNLTAGDLTAVQDAQ